MKRNNTQFVSPFNIPFNSSFENSGDSLVFACANYCVEMVEFLCMQQSTNINVIYTNVNINPRFKEPETKKYPLVAFLLRRYYFLTHFEFNSSKVIDSVKKLEQIIRIILSRSDVQFDLNSSTLNISAPMFVFETILKNTTLMKTIDKKAFFVHALNYCSRENLTDGTKIHFLHIYLPFFNHKSYMGFDFINELINYSISLNVICKDLINEIIQTIIALNHFRNPDRKIKLDEGTLRKIYVYCFQNNPPELQFFVIVLMMNNYFFSS
jgi:hypothetical protein